MPCHAVNEVTKRKWVSIKAAQKLHGLTSKILVHHYLSRCVPKIVQDNGRIHTTRNEVRRRLVEKQIPFWISDRELCPREGCDGSRLCVYEMRWRS